MQALIALDTRMQASQCGFVGGDPTLLDVSSIRAACQRGASQGISKGGRAYQKGLIFGIRHAFSFVPVQPVTQQVIPSYFSMKALMEQIQLRLLCRLDAPSVVPHSEINKCRTYRDAVQLCWNLRRVHYMTQAQLASEAGLYAPHVSGYLHQSKSQRDLPGGAVRGFEWVCGNTAISQWMASEAKLTVLEEMQLIRTAA